MKNEEIEQLEERIAGVKREIVEKTHEVRDLYRKLNELKLAGGLAQTDEDIRAEYVRTRERFLELSAQPTKTNQYRLLGLSQKMERLERQLQRGGDEGG